MTKIGIIGASGQVGTEVCLFLRTYPDIHPVGIVRAPISGALLRRLGIEVRCGTLGSPAQCSEMLGDCDLVADFSVSSGTAREIKAHYLNNISKAVEFSRPNARYLFISSINAFGMNSRFNRAKHYWIPRSVYAHTKRYGERQAAHLGRKYGKETFVFRLGHVHGLLQRVSEETAELVRENFWRFEYPDTPSYTIFCHSIAEAMVHLAGGRASPGTYTLISEPPWSWKEVLEYYLEDQSKISVTLKPVPRPGFLSGFIKNIKGRAVKLLQEHRETLRANVLVHFPDLDKKSAAYLYTMRARNQVREFQDQSVYRPSGIHEGVFPGQRLPGLSDSRQSMPAKAAQVREMLACMNAGL
jgi:nucleoside-diphosphate-sugar epimerase